MQNTCAILLAAGDGKRMKSKKPKVLCEVLGKPMILWVSDACKKAGIEDLCAVVGNQAELVSAVLPQGTETVLQTERLGTGHAVMQAESFLNAHAGGVVAVLCGDAPFISAEVLTAAAERLQAEELSGVVVTANVDQPTGYGRIVRNNGKFAGIVEETDASPEQRKICEINSGTYLFAVDDLLAALPGLVASNAQGEYYLTDVLGLMLKDGKKVEAVCAEDPSVVLGANDRRSLFKLNEIARIRVIEEQMKAGVEFLSTDGVILSPDYQIGADTKILPGTILRGRGKIGEDCVIGPNALIEDSDIGNGCIVNATQIYSSVLEDKVKIGPFSQVRPNCHISSGAKIGDFVEIKNSNIGQKTAIAHLTYVGDSDVGSRVNFGCGCVTVNYDGVKKYRTTIGDDAFIGCNTNLVAPVEVGNGAYTAAGTTVTKNVPAGALAVGRARQENRDGWAAKKLQGKLKK